MPLRVKAGRVCRSVIKSLRPVSKRSFYLYELFLKKPHMFIAIELKSKHFLPLLRLYTQFLNFWFKGGKCIGITLRENTKDYRNGETFLNILSAWCNNLSDDYEAFFNRQPARKKQLKHIHHILHCMMNAAFGVREFEVMTYRNMQKWYGIPGSTMRKK